MVETLNVSLNVLRKKKVVLSHSILGESLVLKRLNTHRAHA